LKLKSSNDNLKKVGSKTQSEIFRFFRGKDIEEVFILTKTNYEILYVQKTDKND